MELFRWERSPWGQQSILGISWDLFWLFLAAGLLFVAVHALYLWRRRARRGRAERPRPVGTHQGVPERVVRHPLPARIFHWVMAISMLVLVGTAFLPIMGLQFAWVTPHWVAGLVLLASILFHIVHALVWQDGRSIWFDRSDLAYLRFALRRLRGKGGEPPRGGKYPTANKAYHLATTVAGLVVIVTGLLMTRRVDTPLWPRDPYFLEGAGKALVYVAHGLAAVVFVGLIVGHIYLAIRPENLWITRSMIRGWITRDEYLEHHDPARWQVSGRRPATRRRVPGRPRARSEEV